MAPAPTLRHVLGTTLTSEALQWLGHEGGCNGG
jgi:hypothetical protein